MSVTAILPLAAESDADDEGNRSYTVVYAVWTSDPTDGPILVRSALGLTYQSSYAFYGESDPGAYFSRVKSVRKNGESQEGRKEWRATVEYSTKAKKRCDEQQIDDPLLQPEKRSGTFVQAQVPLIKDIFGNAYTNSALHPYFDVLKDDSRPTLVVSKNFPLSHVGTLLSYKDAVNTDTFYGKPKRTWKVQRCSWEEVFLGSCQPYAACTLEFEHNPDTWDFERVDAGFYERLFNGTIELILDDINNLPITEPHPLNGQGRKLTQGGLTTGGSQPLQYRKCRGYPEKPFSGLQIRTSL